MPIKGNYCKITTAALMAKHIIIALPNSQHSNNDDRWIVCGSNTRCLLKYKYYAINLHVSPKILSMTLDHTYFHFTLKISTTPLWHLFASCEKFLNFWAYDCVHACILLKQVLHIRSMVIMVLAHTFPIHCVSDSVVLILRYANSFFI